LGFLGQFAAVSQVELARAQVGGTLTGIFFKDGDIVRKGDILFTIDARPYEITLAEANAQLEVAAGSTGVWLTGNLAVPKIWNKATLDIGRKTLTSVYPINGRRAAAVEEAKARIRDAQFDLDHCRITAPFTGRMGTHLVSVGNLIAGSRTATSPTTLLATLVSLDPIYLDFDMSESDFLAYSKYRGHLKEGHVQKVEVALGRRQSVRAKRCIRFCGQCP